MGTRSLTFVYDENRQVIINMYRQFDGYISGHGTELAEFLTSGKIVQGYSDSTAAEFNGMGCLAAQMIARFKKGVGGFYLHPASEIDCGQDYEYHVYHDRITVFGYDREHLFTGPWSTFLDFCKSPVTEE
jgi:hypothetical protein